MIDHPSHRLFSPREANQTLPLVKRIVHDILDTGREIQKLEAGGASDSAARSKALKSLSRQLEEQVRELEMVGCSYRDWSFDKGLVDFPSELDGELVMLCWRSDEPEVKFYHGIYEGYAGRREIPLRFLEV